MGRIVAVKVLPASKATPEAMASFMHEIRSQAPAESRETWCKRYDAGQDGKVYFLVTEYVPGTDLRKYVRQHGPLSMRRPRRYLASGKRTRAMRTNKD